MTVILHQEGVCVRVCELQQCRWGNRHNFISHHISNLHTKVKGINNAKYNKQSHKTIKCLELFSWVLLSFESNTNKEVILRRPYYFQVLLVTFTCAIIFNPYNCKKPIDIITRKNRLRLCSWSSFVKVTSGSDQADSWTQF